MSASSVSTKCVKKIRNTSYSWKVIKFGAYFQAKVNFLKKVGLKKAAYVDTMGYTECYVN